MKSPYESDPGSTFDGIQLRAQMSQRLENEIRPLIGLSDGRGGYNCCGCSTYDAILDHAIRIVRGDLEDVPDSLPDYLRSRDYAQDVADRIWGGRLADNKALHDAGWDSAWDFGRTVWQAMVAAQRGED